MCVRLWGYLQKAYIDSISRFFAVAQRFSNCILFTNARAVMLNTQTLLLYMLYRIQAYRSSASILSMPYCGIKKQQNFIGDRSIAAFQYE